MSRLVFLFCALALARGDVSHLFKPQPGANRPVAIVRQTQDTQPDGAYQYSFETENGIAAEERAQVRAVGNELEKVAQGSFSWTSPEGEPVQFSYIADANGYQPQGSHLPVAPPIPAAIQRALEWIAAHPEPAESTLNQRRF